MNALILSQLIAVAALPANVCDTDANCERLAWQDFGCQTYYSDRDDDNSGLFLCDRDTFAKGLAKYGATKIQIPFRSDDQ